MRLELANWTHHLNQLLYSYYFYCLKKNRKVAVVFNKSVVHNGAILYINDKSVFFDFSDNPIFLDIPSKYDFYFKRSLRVEEKINNIFPLNFNVPMTYKSLLFLLNLKKDFLTFKPNKVEVFRALDVFGLFTNSGHGILDYRKHPKQVKDFNGNIIFHTRLWNPDTNPDKKEKERRRLQNEFRINACRVLKTNFENVSVGLFSDELSNRLAPDLLLDDLHSKKKHYLKNLKKFNIGLADDGLKDTPGWKIGEYLLYGKAVISTPLNIYTDNFTEGVNFEALSSRLAYNQIPEKVEILLKDKKYMDMGNANLKWSYKYLNIENYFERIINKINNL